MTPLICRCLLPSVGIDAYKSLCVCFQFLVFILLDCSGTFNTANQSLLLEKLSSLGFQDVPSLDLSPTSLASSFFLFLIIFCLFLPISLAYKHWSAPWQSPQASLLLSCFHSFNLIQALGLKKTSIYKDSYIDICTLDLSFELQIHISICLLNSLFKLKLDADNLLKHDGILKHDILDDCYNK